MDLGHPVGAGRGGIRRRQLPAGRPAGQGHHDPGRRPAGRARDAAPGADRGFVRDRVVQLRIIAPFLPSVFRRLVDYVDSHQQEFETGTLANPFALYTETGVLPLLAFWLVTSFVVQAGYTVTFIHLWGATLGKRVAGVRVRPWSHEQRPSWAQSGQRWLTGEAPTALVTLYGLVDWLWPVWDERKQALHDKWPDTVVVRSR